MSEDNFKIDILSEKEVKYVQFDVDMSAETEQMLYDYAVRKIFDDREAMINWAFLDAVKRGIECDALNCKEEDGDE